MKKLIFIMVGISLLLGALVLLLQTSATNSYVLGATHQRSVSK